MAKNKTTARSPESQATASVAPACSSCACSHSAETSSTRESRSWWRELFFSAEIGISTLLGFAAWILSHFQSGALPIVLYVAAIAVGGWPLFRGALRSLRRFSLDMNVLMSAAILGAAWLRDWPEAVSLVVLYAISERLETLSLQRSESSLNALMALAPSRVLLRRDNIETEIEARDVQVGDVFIVRAGERIALDGIVVSGYSEVDQAPVTGESLPVEKSVGDEVFAGTLNTNRVLEVRATRLADEGTTSRIARLVQDAAQKRSPRQRATEKFAARYTPLVFAFALVAFGVQIAVFRAPLRFAVEQSLALLVAACPCAFVISGPIATVCALSQAARNGLVIRGGATLETLANIKTIAFDKTGTLTFGAPQVRDFQTFGFDKTRALQIASALESRSEHPLAKAVVTFVASTSSTRLELSGVEESRGTGISGLLGDVHYRIARATSWDLQSQDEVRNVVSVWTNHGWSVALLGVEEKVVAAFAFEDTLREEAPRVLEALHARAIQSVILSGDNETVVARVAKQVGAQKSYGALLPEQKLEIIGALSKQNVTAMVGDGINDAPSLARADVGIAMGLGSDAAIEVADVALMTNDLSRLPFALELSKKARQIIVQNIALAIGAKAIFIVGLFAGAWGSWQLVGGVLADMGTTLLVTANGLRLLRFRGS